MDFKYKAQTKTGDMIDSKINASNEAEAVKVLQARGYLVLSIVQDKKNLFNIDVNDLFSKPKTKDIVAFTRQLSTLIDADMPLALYIARIAESLSTLIKSGIPILDGIKITADLVGNDIYREILLQAEENVRSGGLISQVLEQHEEMPPLMTSMVAIGEKTGKLDFMLDHVAKFYKTESYETIQNISTLIEPILVLVLGFGVAVLVSSVLLPIYSMVGAG